MASYDKRSITLTVPNPAATVSGVLNLRSEFAQILGFKGTLTGTDTTARVKITDADARVVYLDAADKDYKTTPVYRAITLDDTLTGLTPTLSDSTGAAATAALSLPPPIVRNPITVELSNGGTAGDVIVVDVAYKAVLFGRRRITLTTPASPATITGTVSLGTKYAQVIGFKALVTGTDTTTRIRLKDADNIIFYLDAADKDYKTAAIDKQIHWDDTLTGQDLLTVDSTGAALSLNTTQLAEAPVVKSPIEVQWSNNGTAGDVLTLDLYALL